MISLFINTLDNKKVSAKLKLGDKTFEEISTTENKRPESILTLIKNVCDKASIGINSIDEINVEKGPGSYTGVKVGVSVANALSFALDKKINDQKDETIVEPRYE